MHEMHLIYPADGDELAYIDLALRAAFGARMAGVSQNMGGLLRVHFTDQPDNATDGPTVSEALLDARRVYTGSQEVIVTPFAGVEAMWA